MAQFVYETIVSIKILNLTIKIYINDKHDSDIQATIKEFIYTCELSSQEFLGKCVMEQFNKEVFCVEITDNNGNGSKIYREPIKTYR